jgi:hypothetical protein
LVFAKLVGVQPAIELSTIDLEISEAHAAQLSKPQTGIFFDWGPDQQSFHPHIDVRPASDPTFKKLAELMDRHYTD